MIRKTIFLALAGLAVGLLVLGTSLMSDPPQGPRQVYGYIYCEGEPAPKGTWAYCYREGAPADTQTCIPVGNYYSFTAVYAVYDDCYRVWATYADELKICESDRERVCLSPGDPSKRQDLYMWCEFKP